MSNEVNKAIVRRWYDEFWNAGKPEVADELLHPDYVYQDGYGAGAPSVAANKEGKVGRLAGEYGELLDVAQIGLLGGGSQAAQLHVLGHPLP